ncbi:MAG TPA: peptide MFS transporter [Thermoanaerobaculia bacterium]|jgi:POT family proton-dependent oligopeptide transporter|nr:peptide MFS transporter [Thermoanaerobaculia bacterium]
MSDGPRKQPYHEVVEVASTATDKPPLQHPPGGVWFGHPRGLSTLFFTEMWERLSYYGMRALLVLFMTTPVAVANGGLGFPVDKASAIYGLYTGMVYLLALPGGWVADKIWGQRKAVFVGGCIIAAGHFTIAAPLLGLPTIPTFFTGLILIVLGTGLLKPNISTMVGDLYPEGGARRDSGFSIYYMGINLGAFLGPFVCSTLGEKLDWHWGFSAAGFGMLFGLVQYKLGVRHLGSAGLLKGDEPPHVLTQRTRTFVLTLVGVVVVIAIFAFLAISGTLAVTLTTVAGGLGYGIIGLAILYFIYLLVAGGYDKVQKQRLLVIFWIFILAAIFWSGFEQAGSSLNLFARDLTDRVYFGWEMPTGWLQNVNPIFIIIFSPVFGWLWTYLARRKANPSIPLKFALGLIGLAAGFLVLAWGAVNATKEHPVTAAWLVVTYFLHTCGELSLSPVGLSSITKLAPRDRVGQMMGIWFVASALGNVFAGLVAGRLETLAPSALFWAVGLIIGGAGVVALLVSPLVKKLTAGVE